MISIDLEKGTVNVDQNGQSRQYGIGTPEAFSLISAAWLRSGWDNKQVYSFTWLGRPIIQLPEDMVRLQEVIYAIKPDVIVETGIAHGGSLVFHASLCKAIGSGRVIGIDVEIRPHNRAAIQQHELFPLIKLIEGDSIAPEIVDQVRKEIKPGEKVLVLLDSKHTKDHVLAELNAYAPLVTTGSYIVAMDGIMEQMAGAPRSTPDWNWNNPKTAAREFVAQNPEF
ncbi:MAG TPA: CmcI family methyltransferase, partial [Pyrinomonadaceae bacterium]|nr:CmcI family methyltransferase [Pyrinomonadaceae bacterium]